MLVRNWSFNTRSLAFLACLAGIASWAQAQAQSQEQKVEKRVLVGPNGEREVIILAGDKDQPQPGGSGIIVVGEAQIKDVKPTIEAKTIRIDNGTFEIQLDGSGVAKGTTITATARMDKLSDYYVGLQCRAELDAALRAQLKLEKGKGLVVESVVADSPAAKAGIKEHDVLLKAGDKELTSVNDLAAAVDGSKGNELKVVLLRGGQKDAVVVQPTKRPASDADVLKFNVTPGSGDIIKVVPAPDVETLKKVLEQLPKEGDGPMKIRAFAPGVAVGAKAGLLHDLPDDLSVTVTFAGKKPATIVVRQGDQKWEVTEDSLDKLPEKVQGFVGPLVGRWDLARFRYADQAGNVKFFAKPEVKPGAKGDEPPSDFKKPLMKPDQPKNVDATIEKRLDEMQRRMEELNNSLREIRDLRKKSVEVDKASRPKE